MEELDHRKRGEEALKLFDWVSFMRTPKVREVITNHQLRICGDDCEIWLQPAAKGKPPMTIKCRTSEAQQKIEELIKENA